MLVRGEWKLTKYGGGGTLLFSLHDDPTEQRNLAAEPAYAGILSELDSELTTAIMNSVE